MFLILSKQGVHRKEKAFRKTAEENQVFVIIVTGWYG